MFGVFTWIACFLSNLPGPPIIHFQNFSLSPWPVDRTICGKIDPYRDVIFYLYTRNNPSNPHILLKDNDTSIENSYINFLHPTIIYSHGFLESHLSGGSQEIKNAYLQSGEYNVILMDCERLYTGPEYIHTAINTKLIGNYTAQFLDYLVSVGMNLDTVHVIGFSLGSHIAGYIGKSLTSGRLRRITGLDPAGPLFHLRSTSERLNPSDALFVDAIHSNAGFSGILYSVGHVDFWPNGGTSQPACGFIDIFKRNGLSISNLIFCSHYRAYQLYALSVLDPYRFPSALCKNYANYESGHCLQTSTAYLGIAASPQNVHGDYYTSTGSVGADL